MGIFLAVTLIDKFTSVEESARIPVDAAVLVSDEVRLQVRRRVGSMRSSW